MANKQESNSQAEGEIKIPVFTVLKNGTILKNIFLLENPLPEQNKSDFEETKSNCEEILVVGRHPDCNLMFEHPSISRFHLRIHSNPSSQSLSVLDLSSVHGTWVSGNKIEPGVLVELKEGDKLKLGASTREYRLHWIPISRAYDLENPFQLEIVEDTEEKEHQDENGYAIQNEDVELVQGLDSPFSDMSLLPYVKSLTSSVLPMPDDMKSPFVGNEAVDMKSPFVGNEAVDMKSPFVGNEAVDMSPPEKIHGASEISFLQPEAALLVSGGSQTEDAECTLVRSRQRCLSIWSRRGKHSSVQIRTGTEKEIREIVHIDNTEVNSLTHEKVEMESVSGFLFACENKEEEYDKENHAPSSVFLGSKTKLRMDENGEKNLTLEKVDLTPKTQLLRSMKKMSSLEQTKHSQPLKSSSMKIISDPLPNQAEDLEYNEKENIGSPMMFSNMSNTNEQIFTPDKENMIPGSCSMASVTNGKMKEVEHLRPFDTENLFGKVLEENKSASIASRNMAGSEVNTRKKGADRVPFQSLLVNSPSKSTECQVTLNANPIKCQEIMEALPFQNNQGREEKRSWTMVVDTTSLLNKESRKALQLLQGLKRTNLIIPRIVIRELDFMKRRAGFFRRATEVSAALEWIEDCLVNARSWVYVQSRVEETRPMAPTPTTTGPSLFSEEHCDLMEIISPTAEDHLLEYALLLFKRTNRDGQLFLLTNDLTLKIKAMAEGLNCETAEDFRESLVNPFSERFLWKESSPRGSTWSYADGFVGGNKLNYPGPLKKLVPAAKGLKLILLHNSRYKQIHSGAY